MDIKKILVITLIVVGVGVLYIKKDKILNVEKNETSEDFNLNLDGKNLKLDLNAPDLNLNAPDLKIDGKNLKLDLTPPDIHIEIPEIDLKKPKINIDLNSNKSFEFTNYKDALEASAKYKKPMFLYFGADWCAYCRKMKSETLSDSGVKNLLNKEYITCLINVDKDRPIARKYKVHGIPAYVVADSDESITIKDSGFKNAKEMISWLEPKMVSFIDETY